MDFLMDSARQLRVLLKQMLRLCPRQIPTQLNGDAEEGAGTL